MAEETNVNPTPEEIEKRKANAEERKKATEEFAKLTKHRLPWGVVGVFAWLLLFSVGVLIPAETSRKNLGWKPESEVQAATQKLDERVAELEKNAKAPKPENAAGSPPKGNADPKTPPAPPNTDKKLLQKKVPQKTEDKAQPNKFWSFIVATCTFAPLNIGFLCILAAFIGGCAVNKNEIGRIQQEIIDIENNPSTPPIPPSPDLIRLRHKLDYLTEHPGYSTIRGLVVYLIIISGLFIIGAPLTGVDGNQVVSLGQYMKLAGLFSFFGYLSGYDPTVFSTVIGFGTKQLSPGQTRTS